MATPIYPRILRLAEVKHLTGQSRTAIYEGMAEGTFPQSKRIGKRAVGWSSIEVQAWVDAILAEGAA